MEKIGLDAVLNTESFNKGLSTYMKGLSSAEGQTASVATAMSGLGSKGVASLGSAMSGLGSGGVASLGAALGGLAAPVAMATGAMATMGAGTMAAMVAVGNLAAKLVTTLLSALKQVAAALVNYGKGAILAAARMDELTIVMRVVGRNAGFTTEEMDAAAASIAEMGITTDVAARIATRFAQNNIDMANASKLARTAQDAAVIGMVDSSEALDRMMHGIITAQPEILQGLGLTVDFGKAYQDYAAELGKAVTALTGMERQQARVNGVLKAGESIAGTYEAAMGSAGKQLRSLDRPLKEILNQVGAPFQEAFGEAIGLVTDLTKAFLGAVSEGGELRKTLDVLGAIASIVMGEVHAFVRAILEVEEAEKATDVALQKSSRSMREGAAIAIQAGEDISVGFLEKLADTAMKALDWGFNIVASLAEGIVNGISTVLVGAMNFLSNVLTGWLMGSSPPKVAPDIDKWGFDAINEYFKGIVAGAQTSVGQLSTVGDEIDRELGDVGEAGHSIPIEFEPVLPIRGLASMRTELVEQFGLVRQLGQEYDTALQGQADDGVLQNLRQSLDVENTRLQLLQKQQVAYEEAYATQRGLSTLVGEQLSNVSELSAVMQGLRLDDQDMRVLPKLGDADFTLLPVTVPVQYETTGVPEAVAPSDYKSAKIGLPDMGNVAEWASNIANTFVSGFATVTPLIDTAMQTLGGRISTWLSPGSPPKILPRLVSWGMNAMNTFLSGFTKGDFSLLQGITSPLKSALDIMVGLGHISTAKMGGLFADLSTDIAGAIEEFNVTGVFDPSIIERIKNATGQYGGEVAELIQLQVGLAAATNYLTAAQEAYNQALQDNQKARVEVSAKTREYNKLLREGADDATLQAKLAEIEAAEEQVRLTGEQAQEASVAVSEAEMMVSAMQEQVALQNELLKTLMEIARLQANPEELPAGGGGGGGWGGGEEDPFAVDEVMDELKKKIEAKWDELKESIKEKIREMFKPFTDVWELTIKPAFAKILAAAAGLWEAIKKAWEGSKLQEFIEGLVQTIGDKWEELKTRMVTLWEDNNGELLNIWEAWKKQFVANMKLLYAIGTKLLQVFTAWVESEWLRHKDTVLGIVSLMTDGVQLAFETFLGSAGSPTGLTGMIKSFRLIAEADWDGLTAHLAKAWGDTFGAIITEFGIDRAIIELALGGMRDEVVAIFDNMKLLATAAWDAMWDAFETTAIRTANRIIGAINTVIMAVNTLLGINIPTIGEIVTGSGFGSPLAPTDEKEPPTSGTSRKMANAATRQAVIPYQAVTNITNIFNIGGNNISNGMNAAAFESRVLRVIQGAVRG